ncbi:MAG TPA: hypothetical protein VL486_14005 [Verrucomicrobiae bacterium]|nr:hypothetical protein [Verrucomicrobiae bacterium]
MKSGPLITVAAALICGAGLAHADSTDTNKLASPAPSGTNAVRSEGTAASGYIEKFEVPDRDENGNLKWKLDGERAVIRPDGLMDIQNARAEFYTSNKVDMVFSSPTCLLDRANNHATTDDHVRIDRENMVLTGIGGEWDGNTSSMVIRSNVCVIITNGQQLFGTQQKQP